MNKQLFIVLFLILFVPCLIFGDSHDDYVIYDGSTVSYNNKIAYVYLDDDVSLSSSLTIKSGYTLYLCLHGHSLSIDSNDAVITINNNGTLVLSDCLNSGSITSKKGYGINNNGTFNFYGGKISGNGNSGVYNSSIFNMYGGTISNNCASLGGGVYNNKTFNMYAGTIENNAASSRGGGVYNNGSNAVFSMYSDSLVSNNLASGNGGGVYNNGSTFTMLDSSSISNNVTGSISGGGLYAYSSMATIRDNASIVNNKSNVNGGDVYFHSGTFYINDNITIDDIYLPSNKVVTVLDKLGELASVGLCAQYPYKLPILVTNCDNCDVFNYNDTNYILEVVDNTIKLKKATLFPSYTIDIPSSISLNEDLEVSASIDSGSSLIVKVASENDFSLINEDGVSLTYLIKQDEKTLNNNDTILELNGGSTSVFLRFELSDTIKYSGTYTGTAMFTVYIDDK